MPYSNAIRSQVTLDGIVYAIFASHIIIIITLFYLYLFIYLFISFYVCMAGLNNWLGHHTLGVRAVLAIYSPCKAITRPLGHTSTNILYFIFNAEQFIYLNECLRIHSFRFLTTYYYNTPSNANRQVILQKHVVTTVCQWI